MYNGCGLSKPRPETEFIIIDIIIDIREPIKLIERGVIQKESQYIVRAVRLVQKFRKRLNDIVLWRLALIYISTGKLNILIVLL